MLAGTRKVFSVLLAANQLLVKSEWYLESRTNRRSRGRFGLKRKKEYDSSQNSLKGHESKVMSSLSLNMFVPQLDDSGPKRWGDFKYQVDRALRKQDLLKVFPGAGEE